MHASDIDSTDPDADRARTAAAGIRCGQVEQRRGVPAGDYDTRDHQGQKRSGRRKPTQGLAIDPTIIPSPYDVVRCGWRS